MPRQPQIPGAAPLLLEKHLEELGLKFVKEFSFALPRKWRFDYLLTSAKGWKCAIEIEGGIWTNGAHVRGKHYESDMEKYNSAAVAGYKVLRFSCEQVLNGTARAFLKEYCL